MTTLSSDEQKERLIQDILGCDADTKKGKVIANQISINIEHWIGAYFEFLKNPPPSDAAIKSEINDVRGGAIELINKLTSLSQWSSNKLESIGCNEYELLHALAKFTDSTANIVFKTKRESRGQPKDYALTILVNTLAGQFYKSYTTETEFAEDDPSGTKAKAAKSKALNLFITECLDCPGIKHPKNIIPLLYTKKTPIEEMRYIEQIH